MALTDVDRLRQLLGEKISGGETEADTMFGNDQIQDFLAQSGGGLTKAAVIGWKAKAAEYANLVNVSEGNSQRQMSDLHKNALAMVEQYTKWLADEEKTDDFEGKRGRVVIGEISRAKRYR